MEDKPLHNEDKNGEELLRRHLKFKPGKVTTDKSALWSKIKQDIAQEEPKVRSIRHHSSNRMYWMAAAASVVLVLAFFFLWPSGVESYQVAYAQQETIQLPDASTVIVNADSRLRYNSKKWEAARTVSLKGEAFFQVEKGQKFTVETALGAVEVRGTAFNVFVRDRAFSVSCQEGSVAVRNLAGAEVLLEAGDQADLINGEWQMLKIESEAVATWRSGSFVYQSENVASIIEEIERQYDVDISFPAEIGEELITMRFDKSQEVEEALESISFDFRLSIKRSGRQIVLE